MNFDNTFARELQGCFLPVVPAPAPRPRELFFNAELADELGGDAAQWPLERRLTVFSGNEVPGGAQPIAQAYAGHQFGGFSPQLGDGRALLLGEGIDTLGRRRDIAFKGSGRTPFARGGDGKAAVGPMLREVLVSEALHALGVPTTRALAVMATGDWVHREKPLPGAVLTRVAASHLRVGTLEFFAARGDVVRLKRIAQYAWARHGSADVEDPALALLELVVQRQARLVAQWMALGFIHGVMNTDNMSISGESIDFGPCAFMEAHDPGAVFSSIDHHGRYAYGNQPVVAQWNLTRLAQALLPAMKAEPEAAAEAAAEVLQRFAPEHEAALRGLWRERLGLKGAEEGANRHTLDRDGRHHDYGDRVEALVRGLHQLLQEQKVDHTLAWRRLCDAAQGDEAKWLALFARADGPKAWLQQWKVLRGGEAAARWDAAAAMRGANPFVIPRNHLVERALAAASEEGDLQPFEKLLRAVRRPFEEASELQDYGQPAPLEVTACYRTFCGT